MNIFEEFWKITSAAWVELVRGLTCILLNVKLRMVESQIDGAKQYIRNVNENSTNFTKNIARYFEEQLPTWIAEREGLEAEMEINGCNKED